MSSKSKANTKITKPNRKRSKCGAFKQLQLSIWLIVLSGLAVLGQTGNGTSSPNSKDNGNAADRNLRSSAKVNPSTLALEFSIPMMGYPGRGGTSVPVGINYSSKVWQMETGLQWWYWQNTQPKYVTDIRPLFAERSAAGWTSDLTPPRIDESSIQFYDQNGNPWSFNLFDVNGLNGQWNNVLGSFLTGHALPCGTTCSRAVWRCLDGSPFCDVNQATWECVAIIITWCEWGGGGQWEPPTVPPPTPLYYIKRTNVVMPDGSTHEFRVSDDPVQCGTNQALCEPDKTGTYLAVDGSGMKLVRTATTSTLYTPGGGRYFFGAGFSGEGTYAEKFTDVDGNTIEFEAPDAANNNVAKWTDTMGREIRDPLPHNWKTQTQTAGSRDITLPSIGTSTTKYTVKWKHLKPPGCEESTDPNCGAGGVNGALEDQSEKLHYETKYFCRGNLSTDLVAASNGQVLFQQQESGIRPCNSFNVEKDANNQVVIGTDGNPIPFATRFNPVVLAEVVLPINQKYEFKYNRFGEISKIIYPTGAFETFVHSFIPPVNGANSPAYDQTNRGVTERRVHNSAGTLQQKFRYIAESGKVTTIASKGDDPNADGAKSERFVTTAYSDGTNYGFTAPTAGTPREERSYDENGALRSRTLSKFITKDNPLTGRDLRPWKSITVTIEGNQALAVKSETEYDENGNSDPSYFSHLNPKRTKSYQFVSVPLSTAQSETLTFEQLDALFANVPLASVSENDYAYDANYKDRGITSLLTESRVLNPLTFDPQSTTNEVLAKTETIYDNTFPASNPNYPYSTETYGISGTFQCPSGSQTVACWQSPSSAYLGRPTTVRLWDSDNNIWHESHTRYDIFGNAVKVKDPAGNEVETFFENTAEKPYLYAYPTKVITPAPDPTGVHGTNQGSQATTTYDFNTGLPLSVTNDLGQTTKTEYNDPLLRPTRVYPFNFSAPESQTVYDDVNRTVKVRQQIDETHWDEATTFMDTLGRAVKTQATDSQGDIFVETEYDFLGRVKRTSNPYRQGDTVFWSRPRYDELSRVVETCAPSENPGSGNAPCPTGTSTGTVSFSFSTVQNAVGNVVTSTDASGRRSRSITNALGQLIRVDEPTGISSDPNADLGAIGAPNQPTYYTYNVQGKLVKVQQGRSGETTPIQYRYFKYDSLGRLIRVMQPEQEPNANLALSDPYNTSGQWSAAFSYNALGDLVRATDANGVSIINEYDKAKRVTKRCYSKSLNSTITATTCAGLASNDISDNTPEVTFLYDGLLEPNQAPASPNYAKGKLTRVSSSVSDTRYTQFDTLGRLTESIQRTPFGTETVESATPRVSKYAYNFAGALVEETYPSTRVVRYEYESDGDLSRIWGKKDANAPERTYANSFSYTASGGIERMKLGNNRWETAKFNERAQLTEIGIGAGASDNSVWKLEYKYGELESGSVNSNKNTGNIARSLMTLAGVANPIVQNYKYDPLYRLTEAEETAGAAQNWIQNFGYDRFGNRIAFSQTLNKTSGAIQTTATPVIDQATNRFVTTNQNFRYDKNGNLTTDGDNRDVVFNGENKQHEVKNASGQTIGRYFYDGEGKRVKKITWNSEGASETTIFVYSTGKLVAEYSNTQVPVPNRTTRYLTEDHLGTPRVITDSEGNVISRRDFLPFGEEITPDIGARASIAAYQPTNDNVKQKFTGYQKDDETGLDFAEARMYENRHGRFTAVDPLLASGKSANPQTFNRFVYVGNSPIVRIDPSGKDWYYNKDTGGYKWYDENQTVAEGYTRVTGVENFVCLCRRSRTDEQAQWRVLDPYRHADYVVDSQEAGIELADKIYRNPDLRVLKEDLGSRADGVMPILHVLSLPVAVAAIPVIGATAPLAPLGIAEVGNVVASGTGTVTATVTTGATAAGGVAAANPAQTQRVIETITIQFGRAANQIYHVFRHTDRLGLDREAVQNAIQNNIRQLANQIQPGQPFNQVVEINGQRIQYTAYILADGTVNVGRIHGMP